MRLVLCLVWSSITAFLPATGLAAIDLPNRNSAVIVSSHIAAHQDAIGAGVIVAVRPHLLRVLTAKHVADRGEVTVWLDRRPFPAEIVRTFAQRDLAVVDAVVPDAVTARAILADPGGSAAPGDAVVIWGENDAGPFRKTGSLVALSWAPPGGAPAVPLVRIACESCARGDSGGGIFDAQGRLLGILVARFLRADGTTVAIVGERVEAALYAMPEDVADTRR